MAVRAKVEIVNGDLQRAFEQTDREYGARTAGALSMAGAGTVAWLRSLTAVMRPPVRAGEGERQAHPGGWADITGFLAINYRFEVRDAVRVLLRNPGLVKDMRVQMPLDLELFNDAEYAAFLENRDAYWVLSRVTDAPEVRDIIDKAVRAAGLETD